MAGQGAQGATSAPSPPGSSGDPVVDANNAWEWSRGYFNGRAFGYTIQLAGLQVLLGTVLKG